MLGEAFVEPPVHFDETHKNDLSDDERFSPLIPLREIYRTNEAQGICRAV